MFGAGGQKQALLHPLCLGRGLGWFPGCAQAEQWSCGLRPGEEGLVQRAATRGPVWATSPWCVCQVGLLHSRWVPRKAAECRQGGVCGAPEQHVRGGGCQHVHAHVSVHICVCVCACVWCRCSLCGGVRFTWTRSLSTPCFTATSSPSLVNKVGTRPGLRAPCPPHQAVFPSSWAEGR